MAAIKTIPGQQWKIEIIIGNMNGKNVSPEKVIKSFQQKQGRGTTGCTKITFKYFSGVKEFIKNKNMAWPQYKWLY